VTADSAAHWAVVDALYGTFRASLVDSLRPREPVVLMDLPFYANVGDHAILLGELTALRQLGHRVTYVPTPAPYRRAVIARPIGRQTILLHGGGNLGDLWPAHQALREQIIDDFPENRIVQLPQSIHFDDAEAVRRARQVMSRHANLTLFVRDSHSQDFAREHLGVDARLCPDAAFALRRLKRPSPASEHNLTLARTDHEAVSPRATDLPTTDWLDGYDRVVRAAAAGASWLDRREGGRRVAGQWWASRLSLWAWNLVATRNLERGRQLLGSGETVVTDRLHAHILCMLMGIPHVIVDNRSKKLTAFAHTWTEASPLVHEADSLADGVRLSASIGVR
jgi:exopolysaccharide biosynthesis predicted pyruvyltransferase EpsI